MKPTPQLIQLVDKCLNQNISRIEMAQLEQLLEYDDALHYYLDIVGIEGDLPFALNAEVETATSPPTHNRFPHWVRSLSIAAAALIIFSIGFYSGKKAYFPHPISENHPPSQSSENSASITSLIGVTWDGNPPSSIELTNASPPIALKSGLMELTFASGVRSLIEGPAVVRVTGSNAAELSCGRMVSDVPKGAEGFTIKYPDGKVIDLGTEFAINIPQNQRGAEVGVYRGEVEVYDKQQNKPLKILENHAVVQTFGSSNLFTSIPFHREDYIRELPSREFSWELPKKASLSPVTLEFDVSHLVWKSDSYRAVIKYMRGADALVIHKADLLLNGKTIATDNHLGATGSFRHTHHNIYTFNISQKQYKKGRWTLLLTADTDARDDASKGTFSPDSSGILLFEDSYSLHASQQKFLGTWKYQHNGNIHQRIFTADHHAQYILNGKNDGLYENAEWKVEKGILILTIPPSPKNGQIKTRELHLLRNEQELIFINRPYRNAFKVK